MALTNFPNGATSFGVPWVAGVPLPFTGNYYWVQQPSGTTTQASPGGSGTLESPFTDINTALDACTANNNDVILFKGTIYIDEAIVWDKAQTHLIGVSNPLMRGKRSRISMASDATVFSPFISVTAAGCMFMNIGTFYGFCGQQRAGSVVGYRRPQRVFRLRVHGLRCRSRGCPYRQPGFRSQRRYRRMHVR
jgi:hypothetical protein